MANLKGGNAIVRFLLAHGEKLGIAAVAVCAGMLVWSALKHDHLAADKQPENLNQLATQASQHVEGFTWDDLDPNNKIVFDPMPGGAMAAIAAEHFPPIDDPWTRPVLDPISLRTDPELVAVEDLEVYGDAGMWASADPAVVEQKRLEAMREEARLRREEEAAEARAEAENERGGRGDRGREGRDGGRRGRDRGGLLGGERGGRERGGRDREEDTLARNDGPVVVGTGGRGMLQGFEQISAKSWVTVVAKVPVEKQFKIYDDVLMSASGYQPDQDLPLYWGYIVERAEVTDEGRDDWKRIDSVNDLILEKAISFYPFEPQELVSERFIHPLLTHPLPPLILRDWDRRVTHSEIPLADEDLPEEMMESDEVEEPAPAEGDDIDMFARRSQRIDDRMGGERIDGPGARRAGSRRQPMMRGGSGMEGGEFEGEREMGRMRSGGGGRRNDRGVFSWDGETPYALFRYFDDDVEPGHRYRYRVRLALADVNHDVSEQYLDKTVTERRSKIENEKLRAFRFTEWSEPSPVASVPLPARVYLVSVKPATAGNFNAEPESMMLVQAFNSELPAEIAVEEAFLRGTVLNLKSKADVIWVDRDELTDQQRDNEFDFRTGTTVIDFQGGDRLGGTNRDLTEPARAVLMDPAGRLFLQSEIDDSEPVTNFQDAREGGVGERGGGRRGGREFFGEGDG